MEVGVGLEGLVGRTRALGVLRNGAVRDGRMRTVTEEYWRKEGEVMKDVFEQPEVLEAQRNALARLDMARIARQAEGYVDAVLSGVQTPAPP